MKKLFLVLIILVISTSAKAIVLPDIYVGGGYINSDSNVKIRSNDTIYTTSRSGNGILLLAGIRPISLRIPVLNGIRLDFQYRSDLSGDIKTSSYGTVLYWDIIRIIPFVDPYIGIGIHRADIRFDNQLKDERGFRNTNENTYSGHVGLNFNLPVIPFNIFVEYRASGKNFRDMIKDPKEGDYVFYDKSIVIGAKIPIL